jgi:hypothetical protein
MIGDRSAEGARRKTPILMRQSDWTIGIWQWEVGQRMLMIGG